MYYYCIFLGSLYLSIIPITHYFSEFVNNDRKIDLVTNDDFMLLAVRTAGPP